MTAVSTTTPGKITKKMRTEFETPDHEIKEPPQGPPDDDEVKKALAFEVRLLLKKTCFPFQ